MRERNNPLRHLPPRAFTIIQAFREAFIHDLADVPARYPTGTILYLSQSLTVPVLVVKKKYQDRVAYRQARTIEELIHEIEISRSPVIFIQYTPAWFDMNNPDDITRFITVCRDRARKKGPVVLLALHTTDIIPSLKDGADHDTSLSPVRLRGRVLALKEQIRLDQIDLSFSSPVMAKKLCGQMKLVNSIKINS